MSEIDVWQPGFFVFKLMLSGIIFVINSVSPHNNKFSIDKNHIYV